jgi:prepilin-type N-terminal cleavage/methylation domain-containing protein
MCSPRQRPSGRCAAAFSLVELITVMAVISILAGISLPAVKGLSGSNGLNSGTRKLADWMNLARSEAIARHTRVRFAVAREWERAADGEEGRLRKISLWAWDAEAEHYLPLTAWEDLPTGVILEPELPDYIKASSYAKADRASVRGECVLDERFDQAEFDAGTGRGAVTARFIEFLPSGSMRIPGGVTRQAIFVATQGFSNADGSLTYTSRAGAAPAAWAQINVDSLTGRVRVHRP